MSCVDISHISIYGRVREKKKTEGHHQITLRCRDRRRRLSFVEKTQKKKFGSLFFFILFVFLVLRVAKGQEKKEEGGHVLQLELNWKTWSDPPQITEHCVKVW